MKTQYDSYCVNGIAEGCKSCVKGEKLVLFVTGKCSRNCYYCSLSNKRKNQPETWANERKTKKIKEIIEEAKQSNSKGAGITGGDPLLKLDETIKYAKALKKEFKNFHIHIYLPTKLVSSDKLKKLSEYIDEVRFHPEFLCKNLNNKQIKEEIKKIKLAKEFFKKQNIGIELPIIPDKKQQILNFILKAKEEVGFVNLNEFESSEKNIDKISQQYEFQENGYVITNSKKAGLWILNQLKNEKIKIHLCTAELKNWHQFKNRLLKHNILPYGKRTKEGTVKYLAIYCKNKKEFNKTKKEFKNKPRTYIDDNKKRIIIDEKTAKDLKNKYKIEIVEEYPTHDKIEVERWQI